ILTGVLNWDSLIPYLNLQLFFEPPFLGAWLFVYGLSYYVLARRGREPWVICLTAIFGAVYAMVILRELAISRSELLAANCLGVASQVISQRWDGKLRLGWLSAPLVWSLFFVVALFRFAPRELGLPFTYFWLLLYASVLLFGGATILAHTRGFG